VRNYEKSKASSSAAHLADQMLEQEKNNENANLAAAQAQAEK
jgi:hypothetical protein